MKQYASKLTRAEIEGRKAGDLQSGFDLLKRMRFYSVPVIGNGWPISVAHGVLTLSYDPIFESFDQSWDADETRPENLNELPWFSLTYEHGTNPTHLAHVVRDNIVRLGAVPIGVSWVMGLEEGMIKSCYDEMFNEIIFWWVKE